ncbi:hypothetical protein SO802_033897 [Lithocarpus litseifolius]|uniref:Uncharacterized protein n=1 Tax=Lithocarpus litseifolius TaxID=425828 RepID=A0AAW2BF20_9ROSI
MGLGSMGKGGKSKNLALKSIEEEIEDSEDEDEDEDEDKDLTFITDEIIKLLQFKKNNKGKPPRKSKSSRKVLVTSVVRTRLRDMETVMNGQQQQLEPISSDVLLVDTVPGSEDVVREERS